MSRNDKREWQKILRSMPREVREAKVAPRYVKKADVRSRLIVGVVVSVRRRFGHSKWSQAALPHL